ncbi:fibrobacter succinogenes major paralogous domain-containing protein [Fibrobacter sp.]|uniref:fibrobacter succinogenes major paralogous domain-containing protein n=1 Tax=Fibrobacter sp. TaxID=35828 RepID=UPI00388FB0FB
MKKNLFALGSDVAKIGAFAFALGLVACGDDGASNSVTNGEKGEVIALADGSGEKVCDDKLDGWVAEAVGKDFRRCQNGEWTKITANEASAEDEIIGGVTVLQSSSSSVVPSEVEGSSSSVTSSSSAKSSSSVVSSSSEKSSSSVASSSSAKSSSSVASSSSAKSSSSVVSSSSEKSSSSVASSSSVKSSSSVVSSSSAKSSSSSVPGTDPGSSSSVASSSSMKAAWAYLNPNIDYGEFTDERDGQVYKTVTIGTQTWMAENLNYAYTGVKYDYSTYTSDSTSWCYENKASNCDKYGRLYTWSAVMDSAAQFNVNAGTRCGYGKGKTCTPNSPHRGICPEGWHVPTNEEYSTLYTYIGGSSTAGSSIDGSLLKSTSGWKYYNGKSGNGTDKYGFSVLPAGYRGYSGDFNNEGGYAYLWSASDNDGYSARNPYFRYDDDYVRLTIGSKYHGQSLRCLKD